MAQTAGAAMSPSVTDDSAEKVCTPSSPTGTSTLRDMALQGPGPSSLAADAAKGAAIGLGVPNNQVATPAPPTRLPVNDGHWTGKPGDSTWVSSKPEVAAATNNKGVKFSGGQVDFGPYTEGKINVPGMDGTNKDFGRAHQAIAEKTGMTAAEVSRDLKARNLTLHHDPNGVTMKMVNSTVHNNVPHAGGASVLRNWSETATPGQIHSANGIARAGRALGVVGMAVGAYVDGKTLVNEFNQSRATGDYTNTAKAATTIAGGWGGAAAGGWAGAQSGAALGALAGPVGAAVGGLVGGAIGGAVGYLGGSSIGGWVSGIFG